MQVVVVGAGPAGLFTAMALANRGGEVIVVDRDPGPPTRGEWQRRGVMQFRQAHTFRRQVVDALEAEMPDVLDDLRAAGATVAADDHGRALGLLCSRMTFDRVLRVSAAGHPSIAFVTGNVDAIARDGRRATGVTMAGRTIGADLVIDASGRDSRFTRAVRTRARVEDCGAAYVSRQYRLHQTATAPPTNTPFGLVLSFSGYWALAYLHDNLMFSVTIVHAGTDPRFRELRQKVVFEAAVRQIPLLADWIDPQRCRSVTPVLPGRRLQNSYRGQLDDSGRPALSGLISVGDAVCTTTPLAGRGVALALLQAEELVKILDEHTGDTDCATADFDAWCTANIKPWFTDHCHVDAERMRRWSGHDIDLGRPLPSDLIVAAAAADPRLTDIVGPYMTMDALPVSLAPAERRAREIYAGGWRPAPAVGPSLDELISVVSTTLAVA